jgi:hypothetical protein
VKVALLCLSFLAVGLTSCTTLENRRDMYCGYGHVNGPYTRMLKTGVKTERVEITATSDYKDVVK